MFTEFKINVPVLKIVLQICAHYLICLPFMQLLCPIKQGSSSLSQQSAKTSGFLEERLFTYNKKMKVCAGGRKWYKGDAKL